MDRCLQRDGNNERKAGVPSRSISGVIREEITSVPYRVFTAVESHYYCVDTEEGAQRGRSEVKVLQEPSSLTHSLLHADDYIYTQQSSGGGNFTPASRDNR